MRKVQTQKQLPEMPEPTRYRYIISVSVVEWRSDTKNAIEHDHSITVELCRKLTDNDLRKLLPMSLDHNSPLEA